MNGTWTVRRDAGGPRVEYATAQDVIDAFADGELAVDDEIAGPNDSRFRLLEAHPVFEATIAELEAPLPEAEEETHLDMNPMIDVSLVLLIFFILTATYATLRRTVELPAEPPEESHKAASMPKLKDIQDKVFKVIVRTENNQVVVRVEGRIVDFDKLEAEMTEQVKRFGKPEAFIDVGPGILWGTEIKIIEACRGAEVRRIHWPKSK